MYLKTTSSIYRKSNHELFGQLVISLKKFVYLLFLLLLGIERWTINNKSLVVHQNITMTSTCKELRKKSWKRPAKIVIPEACVVLDDVFKDSGDQREVVAVDGEEFFVASRRGRKKNMEDKYTAITNIAGSSKQVHIGII